MAGGMIRITDKSSGLPRQDLRYAIPSVMILGNVINTIIIARKIPMTKNSTLAAKAVDMVTSTICFSIGTAIYVAEMQASKAQWPGGDETVTIAQEMSNICNWGSDMTSAVGEIAWNAGQVPVGLDMDVCSIFLSFGNMGALATKMGMAAQHGTDFAAIAF